MTGKMQTVDWVVGQDGGKKVNPLIMLNPFSSMQVQIMLHLIFLFFSVEKPNLCPNNVAPRNGNGQSINCAPATLLGGRFRRGGPALLIETNTLSTTLWGFRYYIHTHIYNIYIHIYIYIIYIWTAEVLERKDEILQYQKKTWQKEGEGEKIFIWKQWH